MTVGVVVAAAVAVDVDCGVYGAAHAVGRCFVFTCDVVAGAVVGRCAYKGQSCREVDTAIHSEGLEGSETLVVVHGEDAVEVAVSTAAEEAVGGIGAEGKNLLLAHGCEGRIDNGFFFLAQ